jgi:hypothetical protein
VPIFLHVLDPFQHEAARSYEATAVVIAVFAALLYVGGGTPLPNESIERV